MPYVKVVALSGSGRRNSPPRRREKLGIGRYYGNYEAMLAEGDIDVVHVCSPNNLHAPMAKKALLAGKHVVCEKPLRNLDGRGAGPRGDGRKRAASSTRFTSMSDTIPSSASSRSWSRRTKWAGSSRSTAHTCRTGSSTRPTTTGGSNRRCPASPGPWPISARTGWTSSNM